MHILWLLTTGWHGHLLLQTLGGFKDHTCWAPVNGCSRHTKVDDPLAYPYNGDHECSAHPSRAIFNPWALIFRWPKSLNISKHAHKHSEALLCFLSTLIRWMVLTGLKSRVFQTCQSICILSCFIQNQEERVLNECHRRKVTSISTGIKINGGNTQTQDNLNRMPSFEKYWATGRTSQVQTTLLYARMVTTHWTFRSDIMTHLHWIFTGLVLALKGERK